MQNKKKHITIKKLAPKTGSPYSNTKSTIHKYIYNNNTVNKNLNSKNLLIVYSFILICTVFILYYNTLSNGYVMDDLEVLQKNSFVTSGFNGILNILTTPHLRGFMVAPNETYRPLSLVMFAIEYQFFGANPVVNHFVNMVIYTLGVISLFIFLAKFFEPKNLIIAFIAAFIFAVHPIHTEVVANIKSRDELLCYFFGFLALVFFLNYYRIGKSKVLLWGMAFLFLSFLSKETVITFLGIVPFVFIFYNDEYKRRRLYIISGTFIVAIAFIALRFIILRLNNNQQIPVNSTDNFLAGSPDLGISVATSIKILGLYLKLLFIPFPLICDYSFNSISFGRFYEVNVLISLLIYGFLCFIGIYRLIKYKNDPWAFGILFYLICISLFTNIPFLLGSCMNERFTFFASTGFCILIALLADKILSALKTKEISLFKNTNILLFLIIILFVFGKLTITRNGEWKDNYTLFSTDLKKLPENARLNYCTGYELVANRNNLSIVNSLPVQKILEDGIAKLRKAVSIDKKYLSAQIELGNAFFINKQYDSALIHDNIAYAIKPNDPIVLNNLAGIFFIENNYSLALSFCKRAVILNSKYLGAINNEALCYYNMQQYDSAICYFKKAIEIDPNFTESNYLIVNAYKFTGHLDSAKKYQSFVLAK